MRAPRPHSVALLPALVRTDLAAQRRSIRSLRRHRYDLRGAIAAFLRQQGYR